MKLFFYRRSDDKPNYGDELNLWLWDQIIPGILDEDESTAFFGIGTLLNNLVKERAPNAKQIVALGTGAGYNKGMPEIDDSWKIYCLRGPISAVKLGLDPKLAITDGAALLSRLYRPSGVKRYKFSYIPHFTQSILANEDWQEICDQLGIHYIDARRPIHEIIQEIAETEILLAEAMHGAITADTLRTPWIPILTSQWLLPSKWIDWTMSLNLEFQPHPMTGLDAVEERYKLKNLRGLKGSRTIAQKALNRWTKKAQAKIQLASIMKNGMPQLSDDTLFESKVCQLEEKVEEFKRDVASGLFARKETALTV
ncbi:MAG: polysaccharide pyruvyl transferase family protein [Synechococcales cyanobacterium CRU_2_2]|nr:polysaccharide pyruvyl transferase family protein [Synechococcales cyanobacterium CRU_2_2]